MGTYFRARRDDLVLDHLGDSPERSLFRFSLFFLFLLFFIYIFRIVPGRFETVIGTTGLWDCQDYFGFKNHPGGSKTLVKNICQIQDQRL